MDIPSIIGNIIWFFHLFVTARMIRGIAWIGGKFKAVAPADPSPSSLSSLSLSLSPSPYGSKKHDVFLSFRGEDTRAKFTSHLEKRLRDMKIETFIDKRLEKGDDISGRLVEAIRGSKMSVIIFSENYATSSWCLDEVLCIVECMKEREQIVIPVFYEVDPRDIRKQSGTYEAAFEKLKKRFVEKRLNQWRASLTQVANLSGFRSQQYETDSDFIDAIVVDVLKKLKDTSSSDDHFKDLVGIDQSVEGVKKLLQLKSRDVRIIGIWGMGGLGKTTLARVVSERLTPQFESLCFLENVRENSGKLDGLDNLKKKLFSQLLGGKDWNEITDSDKERLCRKRVLVVLDDVDQPEQLEYLAGARNWFGSGSRVIVTTRDKGVLMNRTDGEYKLESLNTKCALELFNLHAFETISPMDIKDREFSERVVNYAQGHPLALRVLGSFLRSKKRKHWEYELEKLKKLPIKDIQNMLRISYEGLDEPQQRVFLDLVCFFNPRECRHHVARELGGGEWLEAEIDNLISRSLVMEEDKYLIVHDLIREMGREVVRQECLKEPGKRSRLWQYEDCYRVFQNNSGTVTVEAISGFFPSEATLELSPAVFNRMHSLRFLKIVGLKLENPQELECFPRVLKYLEWTGWPFKSLPTKFSLHNLVELRMTSSKLERLWSGDQKLENLKRVALSFSEGLIDVSALSLAPNLEYVTLYSCRSLHAIPSLKFGDLDESDHKCNNWLCRTVGKLDLSRCCNLSHLPTIFGFVKILIISFSLIEDLGSASIENPSILEELHLPNNRRLKIFPTSVFKLKSLKCLSLDNCNILEIPNAIGGLSLLEEFDISHNPISLIPPGIVQLSKLKKLKIRECENLKSLLELPLSLELLDVRGCTSLRNVPTSTDVIQQEPWTNYQATRSREFYFLRCPLERYTRLNIMRAFREIVLRTTAAILLNDVSVTEESGHANINICFSGNSLHKWFLFQSEDCSICTKLHPQWHNANFLGFAIAFVMTKDPCVDLIIDFSCKLSFVKNNNKIRSFEWSFRDALLFEDGGSNVMMWYKYENYRECRDAEELSFHFSSKYRGTLRVNACGFRPLYLRDYEDAFGKWSAPFSSNKSVTLP